MSDLIDRQAAIDAMAELQGGTSSKGVLKGISKAWKRIEQLPPAQPEQLGTNLAEVGTDCISRQAAIDALNEQIKYCDKAIGSFDISMKDEYAVKVERASLMAYAEKLEALPSAQPEIIRCRNCKFASGDSRICMKFDHSPIGELDFCSFAERREVTT